MAITSFREYLEQLSDQGARQWIGQPGNVSPYGLKPVYDSMVLSTFIVSMSHKSPQAYGSSDRH